MRYRRMPIEVESPEQLGYHNIERNLSESSYSDQTLRAVGVSFDDNLLLQYQDHLGNPELRSLIAGCSGVQPDEVLVTAGAAAALFIVATSLLSAEDHLVVIRPNYATNLETPRAIGCAIDFLDLRFEDGWAVDIDKLRALVKPNTRLISLTCPHNPTGAMMSEATLRAAVALAEERGIWLLVDETYRDLSFGPPLPTAASLSPRAISVSSLSKAYGLPGIRIGWLLCRDRGLFETLLAAKEQIFICGSVLDEEVARQVMGQRDALLSRMRMKVQASYVTIAKFLAESRDFEWVPPQGGVVGFVRMKEPVAARTDLDRFYTVLLERYKTLVGPGHWFEQPRHYMRIGYGWPEEKALRAGLDALVHALGDSRRR